MIIEKNSKKYLLLIIAFILVLLVRAELAFANNISAPIKEVEVQLLQMKKDDQSVRKKLISVGFENVTEALRDELDNVDKKNTDSLKLIIHDYGWSLLAELSKDARKAFLLIIQHSDKDIEFQYKAIKYVKSAYEEGYIKGQDVALLTDQILLSEGKPQKYGTQFNFLDGEFIVSPLENESKVDIYRNELGLTTLTEYIDLLKKHYAN